MTAKNHDNDGHRVDNNGHSNDPRREHKLGRELMGRDHSFPQQIIPNSAGQFAKFRGSPRQIYHI